MWSVPDVKHVSGTDLRPLVCPARFERATYALEALKMRLNNSRINGFKVFNPVLDAHREPWCWMELGGSGMASVGGWMVRHLICRVNRQIEFEGADGLLLISFMKSIIFK